MSKIDERSTMSISLMLTLLGLGGGFWGYCEVHFARADRVEDVSKSLVSEVEERRELKAEVDQLYLRMIPKPEQIQLKHRPDGSAF